MSANLDALIRFAAAMERLGVRYLVGGSVASSTHGVMRTTQDIDVVVELSPDSAARLAEELGPDFEVDVEGLKEAARRCSSDNVFFMPEFTRIDVYVPKDTAFNRSRMARRQWLSLGGASIPVASPEDVVLKKLEWFRKGGEVSGRQWSDVLGVLKVQGTRLDRGYLDEWAEKLGVADLLARSLSESVSNG
jgi:hypothetical protein